MMLEYVFNMVYINSQLELDCQVIFNSDIIFFPVEDFYQENEYTIS